MEDVTSGVTIRPREAGDVAALIELLAEQQPASRYPFRWPLPFPAEEFVARPDEEAAWVALVDGQVAGQVAVLRLPDDDIGRAWSDGVGLPPERLALVAAFFVATGLRGRGVGRGLLGTAVTWIREHGRVPVLDVVQSHRRAIDLYLASGWRVLGEARPDWLPDDEPPVLLMAAD